MTIRLTQAIRSGGAILSAGTTQNLEASLEADLVQRKQAIYVFDPAAALNDVPVRGLFNALTGGIEISAGTSTVSLEGLGQKVGFSVQQANMCIFDQLASGAYLCTDQTNGDFGRRLFLYSGDPVSGTGTATALTGTSVAVGNALKNTLGATVGNNSNGITNAWVVSNGDIFFTCIDNNSLNYLFRAKSATYTVGSDAGYSNKQSCIDIGLNGGVQTAAIRILTKRSFLEATVNGAKHYYFCEYNVSPGRTSGAGGAGHDQVICYRSTDGGITWSTFFEFNTGGSHQISHFHGAVQDPYTGWIYFMTGDVGAECNIIGYNGTAGPVAANATLATIAATAGYKVIGGNELARYCDLCFSPSAIYSLPDSDTEAFESTTTAFVSTMLPKLLDYVSTVSPLTRFSDVPPILALQTTNFDMFVSFRTQSAATAGEPYIHVWTADAKGGASKWKLTNKLHNYKASTGVPRSLFMAQDGRIVIGGRLGDGLSFDSAAALTGSSVFLTPIVRPSALPSVFDGT